jgi:hypothetical protein
MKLLERLPVTFHETFIPERRYIGQLLTYAAKTSSGTVAAISEETGIPQGANAGKVTATTKYAEGMGLLTSAMVKGTMMLTLTPLGKKVYENDKSCQENLTQWLLHLNMCRAKGGAEVWFRTFSQGTALFGNKLSERSLIDYLEATLGTKNRSILGPLINMYGEEASFKRVGCLRELDQELVRLPLPLITENLRGYAAIFLRIWSDHFFEEKQVSFTEFEQRTGFFATTGCSDRQIHELLEQLREVGAITVDRQLGTPILTRLTTSDFFVDSIYADLI